MTYLDEYPLNTFSHPFYHWFLVKDHSIFSSSPIHMTKLDSNPSSLSHSTAILFLLSLSPHILHFWLHNLVFPSRNFQAWLLKSYRTEKRKAMNVMQVNSGQQSRRPWECGQSNVSAAHIPSTNGRWAWFHLARKRDQYLPWMDPILVWSQRIAACLGAEDPLLSAGKHTNSHIYYW